MHGYDQIDYCNVLGLVLETSEACKYMSMQKSSFSRWHLTNCICTIVDKNYTRTHIGHSGMLENCRLNSAFFYRRLPF